MSGPEVETVVVCKAGGDIGSLWYVSHAGWADMASVFSTLGQDGRIVSKRVFRGVSAQSFFVRSRFGFRKKISGLRYNGRLWVCNDFAEFRLVGELPIYDGPSYDTIGANTIMGEDYELGRRLDPAGKVA